MYKIQPKKKPTKSKSENTNKYYEKCNFFKNSEQIHEPQTLPLFFKLIQTNS